MTATTRHEQQTDGRWVTIVTFGLAAVVLNGWVHSREAVPAALAMLHG
jgi:hypothetical protein